MTNHLSFFFVGGLFEISNMLKGPGPWGDEIRRSRLPILLLKRRFNKPTYHADERHKTADLCKFTEIFSRCH